MIIILLILLKYRYLTLAELSKVCEHIGMDDMNKEELQQLFDKLDVDGDGRVSFQEFTQVNITYQQMKI